MLDLGIKKDFLPKNPYSRPGDKIHPLGMVIHWSATPRATAKNIRDGFERLAYQKEAPFKKASTQFAVDKNEVVQMMPAFKHEGCELAYHSGAYNLKNYTECAQRFMPPYEHLIGSELCHKDLTGRFEDSTIYGQKKLCVRLCMEYEWNPHVDIYRHYDMTGKDCPRWYVHHPKEWEKFKQDVWDMMVKEQEGYYGRST